MGPDTRLDEREGNPVYPHYEDGFQHISDELRLLDLRLLRGLRVREKEKEGKTPDAGSCFITADEIASKLNLPPSLDRAPFDSPDIMAFDRFITEADSEIQNKLLNTGDPIDIPFNRLVRVLGLNQAEMRIIVLALANEIDQNYGWIYSFFNDDVSGTQPTPRLALVIFFDNPRERRR